MGNQLVALAPLLDCDLTYTEILEGEDHKHSNIEMEALERDF